MECRAVRAYLSDVEVIRHDRGTVYELGIFKSLGRSHSVAVVEVGMSNPVASQEVERAIAYFEPSVALFVGVAGGLKDVCLGDVVASTKVYGYEAGNAGTTIVP